MSAFKKGLMLAGATVVAAGMSMSGAQAFDKLDWDYYLDIWGKIKVDFKIHGNFDPKGLIMLEAMQTQIGDVKAVSIVHDITNVAPNGTTHKEPVDLGKVVFNGKSGDVGTWKNEDNLVDKYGNPIENQSCKIAKNKNSCTIDLGKAYVTIDMGDGPLDALTELPNVLSTATAVGNNVAMEGPTFTQFHVSQTLKGEWKKGADVDAKSLVWDIVNASVDSSATAVGNNLSVDLETAGVNSKKKGHKKGDSNDLIVIGDLSQYSHADLTALSVVSNVGVVNYNNLANLGDDLGRNLVSSVATSVGNNASISVSVGGN